MTTDTIDWNRAEEVANSMPLTQLNAEIGMLLEALDTADKLDRQLGTDRGGYYRDLISVYRRVRDAKVLDGTKAGQMVPSLNSVYAEVCKLRADAGTSEESTRFNQAALDINTLSGLVACAQYRAAAIMLGGFKRFTADRIPKDVKVFLGYFS